MTTYDEKRMRTPAHLRDYTTLNTHERAAFYMEARNAAGKWFSNYRNNPEFAGAVAIELARLAKSNMRPTPEPVVTEQVPEPKRERERSIFDGIVTDA
jgi:hypothetical protein